MKKIFLIFAVTLLFCYCYDNGVQLEAKEILSNAETDSSYVDSDYLYGSSILTIRDYYEDYYNNLDSYNYVLEQGLYLKNLYYWYSASIYEAEVGQTVTVYNKAYGDNPITNIVPKKYFTRECEEVVVGNEYGFYISTEYINTNEICYGSYDASEEELEVVGHGLCICF